MSNLKVLEPKTDVRETLESALADADKYECVMIVALPKEGGPIIRINTATGYQKSFMVGFVNSWLSKWFWDEV